MNFRQDSRRQDSRVEQIRIPPQSIEAEQAVLGGLMLSVDALPKVADMLTEEDFCRHDHQLIYRAIRELARQGQPYDPVTMGDWFVSTGFAEQVAGGAYLVELATTTPSAANIVAYAEIVADKSRLRRLIDAGTAMVNAAFQPDGRETDVIVAEAARSLSPLAARVGACGPVTMREVGRSWFEALNRRYNGEAPGLATPWGEFNRLTGGLQPGDLMILAGRPGMGKSAAAINALLAWSLAGKTGLYFSLEMTKEAIYNRCVAALGDIPLSWLKNPANDGEEYWSRTTAAIAKLKTDHFIVDDEGRLNWDSLQARIEREAMRRQLSVVAIDHAHIVRLAGKTRADIELGEVSGGLKALGKKYGFAGILLAQLNRGVEARANKRPTMADLRECGAFEQDADIIAMMYRDDYYAKQEGRASQHPGLAEMILAKMREGETGTVWLRSRLDVGRFDEAEAPEFDDACMRPKKGSPFSYMRNGREAAAGG